MNGVCPVEHTYTQKELTTQVGMQMQICLRTCYTWWFSRYVYKKYFFLSFPFIVYNLEFELGRGGGSTHLSLPVKSRKRPAYDVVRFLPYPPTEFMTALRQSAGLKIVVFSRPSTSNFNNQGEKFSLKNTPNCFLLLFSFLFSISTDTSHGASSVPFPAKFEIQGKESKGTTDCRL